MKKLSRKEIQLAVESALAQVVESLSIGQPSKKTKKSITKLSVKMSRQIRTDRKKQTRKAVAKTHRNGKSNAVVAAASL